MHPRHSNLPARRNYRLRARPRRIRDSKPSSTSMEAGSPRLKKPIFADCARKHSLGSIACAPTPQKMETDPHFICGH